MTIMFPAAKLHLISVVCKFFFSWGKKGAKRCLMTEVDDKKILTFAEGVLFNITRKSRSVNQYLKLSCLTLLLYYSLITQYNDLSL